VKAQDQIGTYYIPEGETRHLRFPGDFFAFRNGQLWVTAVVDEIEATSPILLNQYGADQLLLNLLALEPDPSCWVRVHRFQEGGWSVEEAGDDFTPSTTTDMM
jgi:hypothetical protein